MQNLCNQYNNEAALVNGNCSPVDDANRISMYPNPVGDYVHITGMTGETYHFKLYDSNAKIISEQNFTASTTVETSGLAQGTYFYSISQAGKVVGSGKIIK